MYIGTPPQSGFISQEANQYFTGLTQNYIDLNQSISSLSSVIVLVNGVVQENSDLTLTSSSRITLGATLVSADKVTCIYVAKISSTQAPATGSVTSDMLSGSIANSKLANSSITLNGSAVSLGGSATVGGTNTPNFYVWKEDANQTISNNTNTLITFNDEKFDSDSAYASNKFTVPSGKQGVYFINGQLTWLDPNVDDKALHVYIYKNGSQYTEAKDRSSENDQTVNVSALLSLSAGDYIEIYGRQGTGGNLICTSHISTFFFGFKLI